MPENLPVPHDQNWFAEWISSGKVPGAVKAIAHLIGSVGNAGAAWINIATVKGEQLQQDIKNETEGRKSMYAALSKAAQKQAVTDSGMVDRTIDRLAGKALRAQANVEAVAKKVAENIDEGEKIDPSTATPDDDWLDFITSQAEKANSEKVRDTWAKVITGEIRRPGSFSFRTLQFISVLDKKTAEKIENVFKLVAEGAYIPYHSRFDFTDTFEEIRFAKECGILGDAQAIRVTMNNPFKIYLPFGPKSSVYAESSLDKTFDFPQIPLTVVGRELYELVKPDASIKDLVSFGEVLFKTGMFEFVQVQTYKISASGTREVLTNILIPTDYQPDQS